MGIPPRLSKFITTFSVLLIIVSIILPSLVSVQPSTQGNIALLSITSSAINGPTVVFGLLGSCGRSSPVEPFSCTPKKVSPQYNLSFLPQNAVNLELTAPPGVFFVWIWMAIACTIIFLGLFVGISIRTLPKNPWVVRTTIRVGWTSGIVGFLCFMVIRMWFSKISRDFNAILQYQGQQNSALVASVGNGFILAWVSYGLMIVPLLISLAQFPFTDSQSGHWQNTTNLPIVEKWGIPQHSFQDGAAGDGALYDVTQHNTAPSVAFPVPAVAGPAQIDAAQGGIHGGAEGGVFGDDVHGGAGGGGVGGAEAGVVDAAVQNDPAETDLEGLLQHFLNAAAQEGNEGWMAELMPIIEKYRDNQLAGLPPDAILGDIRRFLLANPLSAYRAYRFISKFLKSDPRYSALILNALPQP